MKSASVHILQAREGRIINSYRTRDQERVWIIEWDDHGLTPPEDITEEPALAVGCRVRLAGGRLERMG